MGQAGLISSVKETGILIVSDYNGETQKPTFTCAHCGRVGIIGQQDGGMCLKCRNRKTGFGLLCKNETCLADCNRQQLIRIS